MIQYPFSRRLGRLREQLTGLGADALLVSQPENRSYLSGFTGSSGWLLVSQEAAMIATDFRYFEQVEQECPAFQLVRISTNLAGVLPEMVAQANVTRLAFEADHATFADMQSWSKAAPDLEWIPTSALVVRMRAVKDQEEVAAMRAAISLADEAMAFGLQQAQDGMTEQELSWVLEAHMRTHGAQAVAFETIVSCGPNGARPHARPGTGLLAAGQPIVIDMGARLNGYCSDITRTICLGRPAEADRFFQVYDTVLRAQLAAEVSIRPGMTGLEADRVARDVIAEAGFGDYFGHGLGHGVGLAVHESPRLSRTSTDVLESGMLVTVEPGIYLPGWGGVRVEDIVLVTDDGAEVLTRASKTPIV